jgi:dihydroorotate dehydrogenase
MLLKLCTSLGGVPPVLLKLTPPADPTDPRVIEPILAIVDGYSFVKGFILNITNRSPYTTLRTPRAELDRTRGGITGPSLREPTNAALAAWAARIDRTKHILVGVGGIRDADDAYRMLRNGASWIQLYTALVYQGPGLIGKINEGLIRIFERDGVHHVSDVVGVDVQSRTKALRTATV